MKKWIIGCIAVLMLIFGLASQPAFAEEPQEAASEETQTIQEELPENALERVVLIYMCGADLESMYGCATHNITQILNAGFGGNEDVKCLIMTGGSSSWKMAAENLCDPETGGAIGAGISSEYNQIWEARGMDASEYPGKLVLLDRDGVLGDDENAVPSSGELMSDPEILKAFIDFAVGNYPSKRYDLVLWDHGGGPLGGYAVDEHRPAQESAASSMSYAEILEAVSDNQLVKSGRKFNMIDFDACLMGNLELMLALQDLTDYYIASAEIEPGDGQDYRGWFDLLGTDPAVDTFALGRRIVDDFIAYYETPGGKKNDQDGTLAVIDMNQLKESGFTEALIALNDLLDSQIREGDGTELLYYDEVGAVGDAIRYTVDTEPYRDLGNIASQLCIPLKEPVKHLEDGIYRRFNEYEAASMKICGILGDEDIVYARGTAGIAVPEKAHIDAQGEIRYEEMRTSGLYLFFPTISRAAEAAAYHQEIKKLIESGMIRDPACLEFLSSYTATVIDYAFLTITGSAVMGLIDRGVPENEVHYDKVKEYWDTVRVYDGYNEAEGTIRMISIWDKYIRYLITEAGGEEAVRPWLEQLITQQTEDAVLTDHVTAEKIENETGTGYKITIDQTDKRVIDSVDMDLVAEFPSVIKYYADRYGAPYDVMPAVNESKLLLLTVNGQEDTSRLHLDVQTMPMEEILETYNRWYEEDSSTWTFREAGNKVFALEDAEGDLHAAQVILEPNGKAKVYVEYRKGGDADDAHDLQNGIFMFARDPDGEYVLSEFYPDAEEFTRPMTADNLKTDISGIKTVYHVDLDEMFLSLPITLKDFTISGGQMDRIKLVYTEVDDLEDIADVDGDGEKIRLQYTVKDMYHHKTDISDIVNQCATRTE